MSNVLSEAKRQQVIALGRLGWPLRRIEQETGVRRETASIYLKAAGVGVRPPGAWGRRAPAKPANQVTAGSAGQVANPSTNPNPENLSTKGKAKAKSAKPANEVTTGFGVELEATNGKRSVCEPFREAIELGLSRGRDAIAIWQDLVAPDAYHLKRRRAAAGLPPAGKGEATLPDLQNAFHCSNVRTASKSHGWRGDRAGRVLWVSRSGSMQDNETIKMGNPANTLSQFNSSQ